MSTLPPATADAFRLLQSDLYFHLDRAELLAYSWNKWSDYEVEVMRELVADLSEIVRQLLRIHKPADGEECEACLLRWPCGVLETIHMIVTDPERQFVALAREQSAPTDESSR